MGARTVYTTTESNRTECSVSDREQQLAIGQPSMSFLNPPSSSWRLPPIFLAKRHVLIRSFNSPHVSISSLHRNLIGYSLSLPLASLVSRLSSTLDSSTSPTLQIKQTSPLSVGTPSTSAHSAYIHSPRLANNCRPFQLRPLQTNPGTWLPVQKGAVPITTLRPRFAGFNLA